MVVIGRGRGEGVVYKVFKLTLVSSVIIGCSISAYPWHGELFALLESIAVVDICYYTLIIVFEAQVYIKKPAPGVLGVCSMKMRFSKNKNTDSLCYLI